MLVAFITALNMTVNTKSNKCQNTQNRGIKKQSNWSNNQGYNNAQTKNSGQQINKNCSQYYPANNFPRTHNFTSNLKYMRGPAK